MPPNELGDGSPRTSRKARISGTGRATRTNKTAISNNFCTGNPLSTTISSSETPLVEKKKIENKNLQSTDTMGECGRVAQKPGPPPGAWHRADTLPSVYSHVARTHSSHLYKMAYKKSKMASQKSKMAATETDI